MVSLNGNGPASAVTESEAEIGFRQRNLSTRTPTSAQVLRAELHECDTASAAGVVSRGHTPVLVLARELLAAGLSPDTAMDVFRGGTLALRIASIGKVAGLEINADGSGFRTARKPDAASPIRQTAIAVSGQRGAP